MFHFTDGFWIVFVFEHDGKTHRIDAVDEGGDKLFLIIADQTSGEETYGGGRFMYVNSPDSTTTILLDFNKSYNPLCVLTKYANTDWKSIVDEMKKQVEKDAKAKTDKIAFKESL